MKKLIYLIMAVWAFTSCNDSDEAFTVEISAEGFHFTPIMGGLVTIHIAGRPGNHSHQCTLSGRIRKSYSENRK